MTDLLRRYAPLALELRDGGGSITLEGYASTFGQPYDLGPFKEEVAPGAFTRSLASDPDVPLLVDHAGSPLARTKSGTLQLSQDSTGLHTRAVLDPQNPTAAGLISAVRRGDLDAMSFAFRVAKGGDAWNEDFTHRTLNAVNIHNGDVSVVTNPANPNTSVGLRALDEQSAALELINAILGDVEPRAGRMLSAENMGRLQAALSSLRDAGDAHTQALDQVSAVVAAAAASADPADATDDDDITEQQNAAPTLAGLHLRVARARLALAGL